MRAEDREEIKRLQVERREATRARDRSRLRRIHQEMADVRKRARIPEWQRRAIEEAREARQRMAAESQGVGDEPLVGGSEAVEESILGGNREKARLLGVEEVEDAIRENRRERGRNKK